MQAVLLTVFTFLVLFLIVSLVTFKTVKVTELVELIQAGEKPKPEPKASIILSLLSLISIGYGYISVFRFIQNHSFIMLVMGVLLVIIGTYFYIHNVAFIYCILRKGVNFSFKENKYINVFRINLPYER